MAGVEDAFIEADGGFDLRLQFGVGVDVVPAERLLHHEQLELIELTQVRGVFEAIGRVGVDGKKDVRKFLADCGDVIEVFAGFDFQLDALIAAAQFFFDAANKGLRTLANAERDAAGNFIQCAAIEVLQEECL